MIATLTIEEKVEPRIISVNELITNSSLSIPIYQRPYKWSQKNVNQLIEDVVLHVKKSSYRLGTVILHKDVDEITNITNYNIVDGQQRTITLVLIAKAILERRSEFKIKNENLNKTLDELSKNVLNFKFTSEISFINIQNNYQEIYRRISNFNEEIIYYFLNKCEFIIFELSDVSEAFQFFDSQNARGKDLEPHDLLKAFHLREFSSHEEHLQENIVETWEGMKTEDLAELFAEYLYRIKGWAKGNSSRYFTKNNVDLFKGINIEKVDNFPYTESIRIAHFYVDRYNKSYERSIDFQTSKYPFQLNQAIINGRRFFEMITHYKEIFNTIIEEIKDGDSLTDKAKEIFNTIDSYDSRYRTGDIYVRNLFNCALIFYVDKFGFKEISLAVEKIFIWAYSIRLRYYAIQLATVDNNVLEKNIFKRINNANHPNDVLNIQLNTIEKASATNIKPLKDLFFNLKYLQDAE